MYFIADNGNIYSSGVLAKRLKEKSETIVEIVRASSWKEVKKKQIEAIYRGPAKRG